MPAELKPSSLRSENGKWPLIIFAAALVVRVVNVLFLSASDPAFFYPQIDSLWHHLWAIDILKNDFWGQEVYFRGPLYPYFLALLYFLSGSSILFAKVIQAIGGAGICLLLYLIAKHCFGEKSGRVAGFITALYGPMIFYESELLIEWLAILLALGMLLLLLRLPDNSANRTLFCAGVLGGLSAIARPNLLLVLAVITCWILLRNRVGVRLRNRIIFAGIFAAGALLCVLPVTVRNYAVADDFVLISSQGGVNLHLANNAEADGLTMVMPEIRLDLSVPWSEFVDTTNTYAESATGRRMKASEISSFWSSRAWDYIWSHPGGVAALTGKRLVYLFSGFENSDQSDIYSFRTNSPILAALIFAYGLKIPFGLIGPLSLIGLVLAWRERKCLALLYLFLLGYIPTVAVFLVTARHRLAIVAVLIPFAAYAAIRIWELIQRRELRSLIAPMAALALLLPVLNHNWFELGFTNPAQFHYQRGMVLEKQGKLDEAIAAYRESLTNQPIPEALVNLGFALNRKGDAGGAYEAYQRALTLRPQYAEAFTNLGQLFLSHGELDSASLYLERAQQLNPGLPQIYLNLGEVASRRGDSMAAEEIFREGLSLAPRFPAMYNALANLCLQQGRTSEAESLFVQSLTIDDAYAIGHANLANLLLSRHDYGGAREHYGRALALNPALKQAHVNLGLLFLQANQPDSARASFERVLKLDPNDPQARQALEKLSH